MSARSSLISRACARGPAIFQDPLKHAHQVPCRGGLTARACVPEGAVSPGPLNTVQVPCLGGLTHVVESQGQLLARAH